ncbi:protein FAR1-RELATED SEQUENCE 5-like [Lotus japonicus]|uniref:protein FAR1-RELATED SEQUENCE 5-like n=1 Tax=Lotus japonicus TaxID=34305 RepID=UPI00258D9C35|nr:protein FAR1-RELATED SEQUENCE 5-like [Lotus japonicus]
MKGKQPAAVITDGAPAMRNAITRLLPKAHHRLCAWHLLQNAQRNVGDSNFVKGFKSCMLGNYTVAHFKKKWFQLVSDLNLEDNPWVQGLYEKRHMWATCMMRGKFFAGFRTTSRCEDYKSVVGDAVPKTNVRALELCAANLYTRTVFLKFRSWLSSGSLVKVAGMKDTSSCIIYSMYRYCKPAKLWYVAHDEQTSTFRCSCQRMETFGLPCDHIIGLLVHLDIDVIPKSLVLQRWCKSAKESMKGNSESAFKFWESTVLARLGSLVMRSREMFNLGCESMEDYLDTVDVMAKHVEKLKAKKVENKGPDDEDTNINGVDIKGIDEVKNPHVVKSGSSSGTKRKCSVCKQGGHNKTTCPDNKRQKVSALQYIEDNIEPPLLFAPQYQRAANVEIQLS